MKIKVIYSSLTGCTKRIADGIYNGYKGDKEIYNVKEHPSFEDADVLALGFWVERGRPSKEMLDFLNQINDKKCFVFCTLGYYPDSQYGIDTMLRVCEILQANGNEVIGHFIGNGALPEAKIKRFKKLALEEQDDAHGITIEKALRYELLKDHPSVAEVQLASERFNERVELIRRVRDFENS